MNELTENKEKKRVLPGEPVAASEEYMAGFGTYEDDGTIYASAIGSLVLNDHDKKANLRFDNPPNAVWIGDTVFCGITDVRASMVIGNVISLEGSNRGITGETAATIHVSKLSNKYVEDASREYRKTDLVRAEVIQAKPSIQLTTAKPHLGVVFARCGFCREPLDRKDRQLFCRHCEKSESRKLAKDYRDIRPANSAKG